MVGGLHLAPPKSLLLHSYPWNGLVSPAEEFGLCPQDNEKHGKLLIREVLWPE